MSTLQLKVNKNTVLKHVLKQSSDIKKPEYLLKVVPGLTFEINWYREISGHYEVELKEPINGFYNWFAYHEFFEILGEPTYNQRDGYINLNIPYYSQRDNRTRPHQTCNMTSAAMVIDYLNPTYRQVNPKFRQLEDELTDYCVRKFGHSGIYYHENIVKVLRHWGVESKFSTTTSFHELREHLDNKLPAIFSGKFTRSGHIVVIKGYDDSFGCYIVNDPWGTWSATHTYINRDGEDAYYSYVAIHNLLSYTGPNHGWIHLCSKIK